MIIPNTPSTSTVKMTDVDTATPFTTDEARACAMKFINSHFKNKGKDYPRISIPADVRMDDDIRLIAHIERTGAELARLREWIAKAPHLHDCCSEYNEDTRQWEVLPDENCWCGRTKALAQEGGSHE